MRTYHILLACFVAIWWSGCATYKLEVGQVSLYHEGVQIVDSNKPQSKVRLEVGQSRVGSSNIIPLALFISARNLSKEAVIFDTSCVQLYQNGKLIPPLHQDELKTESFDYGYIIESYHLYIPPQPNIEPYTLGMPFVYGGYMGGFYMYPQMFIISARERMQQQIRLDEQRAKRAIIVSSAMQKNTLEPNGAPRGGFILYAPSKLQAGTLELRVKVGHDEHTFTLQLRK